MNKKPNVIFFFTDDQRFNTISALNNENIITPNMDLLVKNGTSFTNACIEGGTSAAVCMPSRAMLHSGKSLFHLEKRGEKIPKNHALLGETLKENGYETIGIGKWHNGTDAYYRSFTNGDKIFFGGMDDHWNVPVHSFDQTGNYDGRMFKTNDFMYHNDKRTYISDHMVASKHSTDLFGEAAINMINQSDFTKPMFMYVSFMAPHDPRTMPQKYMDMYDINDIDLPDNYMEEHPFDFGVSHIRDEVLEAYPRKKEAVKKHLLEYYAMITHVDDQIGKVIQKLKDINQYDNTIFILAGDNGLGLGCHGLMGKQNLYDHSIRVPLVFSGRGILKNVKSSANVYLYDLFPTICDLTVSPKPTTLDGTSLVNAISNDDKVRECMYYAYINSIRAIKYDGYKLIEYRTKSLTKTQLFNLEKDPSEVNDLSTSNSDLVIKMRKELIKQRDIRNEMDSDYGKAFYQKF